jgi:hypothetical protein
MPRAWDPDERLPAAFHSPQATFATWLAASRTGEREAIQACYWDGMTPEELAAWLAENQRPGIVQLLQGARWVDLRAVSPVEINFRFVNAQGQTFRGVMVRTGQGWKLQRW